MICPGCNYQAGSVRLISEVEAPAPSEPEAGDVVVCPNCLAVLAVDAAGGFRVMRAGEMIMLSTGSLVEIDSLQRDLLAQREREVSNVPRLPVTLN